MKTKQKIKKVLNKEKQWAVIKGDCLIKMKHIPDNSIDLILSDLPFGVTQNEWDKIIPFEPLWEQYKRIIKDNGAIVLTASQPFTSMLITSNLKMFKYCWVWDKEITGGFLNANKMPLRLHEDICVFYKKQCKYNPQMTTGDKSHSKGRNRTKINNNYGEFIKVDNCDVLGNKKYPKSIITFLRVLSTKTIHPTEKPVNLLEYLIKTYTDKDDVVLDNCMGSGSTGIACKNIERRFVGIEKNSKYYKTAKERIKKHRPRIKGFNE